MTDPNYPNFAYHTDAWSYVERAQKQLQLFDAGNPESLFYAAFELCTGIEARLYDGLRTLLQYNITEEEKRKHTQRIEKLGTGKLCRKLATIDENTLQPYTLMIRRPGGQSTSVLHYTAVTRELAKDWTRVSKLLHYRFFIDKKEWFHKTDIAQVLREKTSFLLRCRLDGIKKLQGRVVTGNRCASRVSITEA
jgi:hypothetical protein